MPISEYVKPNPGQATRDPPLTRIPHGEFDLTEQLPRETDLSPPGSASAGSRCVRRSRRRGTGECRGIERGCGTYVNPRAEWSQLDPIVLDALIGSEAAPEPYRHLTDLRRVVETGMAGLAAARRTRADLSRLRRTLDDMSAAAERGSVEDFAAADLAFHDAVLAAAGNPLVDAV
jgi:FCD domain-containing protein